MIKLLRFISLGVMGILFFTGVVNAEHKVPPGRVTDAVFIEDNTRLINDLIESIIQCYQTKNREKTEPP